ncbi:hypothetical protein V9T40_002052 [Parthenolecanium corni]|uniref:Microsomal glutathione S-transferase 1 n=1 Tax=Parthenolecanium corni TaxID=536013 RepID=A0AAN9THQ0_9HEMI
MHSSNLLSLENPVFKTYLFYASILVGKMLIMSPLTARWRFRKGVFATPEDTVLRKDSKVKHDDDVERVRRAHLNDLENIPIFLISCCFYILTDPHTFIAINLIRVFTICRIIHTYVYAIHVIPQPTRALVWGVANFINWYMIVVSAIKFVSF